MTLQTIAEREHLEMIKKLLMRNINVNIIITADDYDQTTLQMIADEEHLEIMKRLLMTNVDINVAAADDDHD